MKVKSIGVATLVAASMAWTPVNAADLGGDCCADLEERVAELEATTARKGNRRVSLTVSGQVNELIYWFDDGYESNVYQGTSGFSSSRFRFTGDATISADWSAGYLLEIEVIGSQVNKTDDETDDANAGIKLRHSAWYLKSKTLGRLMVGQTSFSADDITSGIGLGGTATATQGNIDAAPGMGHFIFDSNVRYNNVFQVGDVDRGNLIRYDTPSIWGFTLSASWGEDDMWSAALRYAGEFNGIKIAGAVGYFEDRDSNGLDGTKTYGQWGWGDYQEVRAGLSILHVPTGLFADGGLVHREFKNDGTQPDADLGVAYRDFDYWYVRGGIYQRFMPLGKTSIFGEYGEANGAGERVGSLDASDGTFYGVGVQQQIDAAAMEIYFGWRRIEAGVVEDLGIYADGDCIDLCGETDKFGNGVDTFYTGARIKF